MHVEKGDFSKKHLTRIYAKLSKKNPPLPSGSVRRTAQGAFKVSICKKRGSDTQNYCVVKLTMTAKRRLTSVKGQEGLSKMAGHASYIGDELCRLMKE